MYNGDATDDLRLNYYALYAECGNVVAINTVNKSQVNEFVHAIRGTSAIETGTESYLMGISFWRIFSSHTMSQDIEMNTYRSKKLVY